MKRKLFGTRAGGGATDKNSWERLGKVVFGAKKLSYWGDVFLGWQLLSSASRLPLRSLQAAVRTALHFLATDAFLDDRVSTKNFLCQSFQSTSGMSWCFDIGVHPLGIIVPFFILLMANN